jgi:hypothetical protein
VTFHGKRRRTAAAVIAIFVLVATTLTASSQRIPAPPARIEIHAIPIESFHSRDPDQRQFGALEFRGGLELTSRHREFGGLSAIRVAPDGQGFVAVTDNAHWLTGRIVYRGNVPAEIADAVIAPILDANGRTLISGGLYDTEALAQDGGTLYLGIERIHQILRYDFARGGVQARGQELPVPPAIAKLPRNKGLECLVYVPSGQPLAGALIGISERGLDDEGNILGFLVGGPAPGEFSVRRSNEFDVTDCATTADGGLLILERHFSLRRGVAMRIRRVPLSAVKPGATIDGPSLIEADLGYQIDNMEGLSVHRDGNGDIVLTLVSDDNFAPIQRTLLLQFTLLER